MASNTEQNRVLPLSFCNTLEGLDLSPFPTMIRPSGWFMGCVGRRSYGTRFTSCFSPSLP